MHLHLVMKAKILGRLGVATPRFWDGGVVRSPRNIVISYNVQEYETKTFSKEMTI